MHPIQTVEVRFADQTQCLQAQAPRAGLDALGSLYVGWNMLFSAAVHAHPTATD